MAQKISPNPTSIPNFSNTTCGSCNKTIENASRCSRCHFQTYCGKECQKNDWPTHKSVCLLKPILTTTPSVSSSNSSNPIVTELMQLVDPIIAPEDIISDSVLNSDETLDGNMIKIHQKYGDEYIKRCKLDLLILMVRQACHQVSSEMKNIDPMTVDIAVAKFTVGLCREKSSLLLFNLAKKKMSGHILQMINPKESVHTHAFIVMGIPSETLQLISSTKSCLLDQLLASENLYIIDPLLRWHGPSSEYATSPPFLYNQTLKISKFLDLIAQPEESKIEQISRESEIIYDSARRILPTLDQQSFKISKFLKFMNV